MGSNHLTVGWRFADGFPSGDDIRARVKDGPRAWNDLNTNLSFNFQDGQPDYDPFPADQCPSLGADEKDALHWGSLSPGVLASTYVCTFFEAGGSDTDSIHSFQIKFNSDVDFYTGAGDPGSNQIDLWSVAVHEFGHATGRACTRGSLTIAGDGCGHFINSPLCDRTVSSYHTMCRFIFFGKTWSRTLEEHDKDTFRNAY